MMTAEASAKLKTLLVKHEDKRQFPYVDTVGKITIGIGYNLTDRGMPESWINEQYNADVSYFYNQLNEDYLWFKDLSEARQGVLIDMSFMGYKKLKGFYKMMNALANHNYSLAAAEILNSKWATQVGHRAAELAGIMESGNW